MEHNQAELINENVNAALYVSIRQSVRRSGVKFCFSDNIKEVMWDLEKFGSMNPYSLIN